MMFGDGYRVQIFVVCGMWTVADYSPGAAKHFRTYVKCVILIWRRGFVFQRAPGKTLYFGGRQEMF